MDDLTLIRTQLKLLAGMASRNTGETEENWSRFFELYYPAMLKYAQMFCSAVDAEDIVQRVLVKLLQILREGRYERRAGTTFRAYLRRLVKNEFLDWRRSESARGMGREVPVNEKSLVCGQTPADVVDMEWRLALRASATEHVLSATALSDMMRRAYCAYVIEGRSPDEVAKMLGVTRNYVLLAKSRISRRIAAVEAMYGD